MIRNVTDLPDNLELEADVCIIGSGAGGAPAASVLSRAGRKVVVLEEGGHFTRDDFQDKDILLGFREMYYRASSTSTLGNPPIALPLGKTVGGTTTVNSGTMFRTPDKVLKEWEWCFGIDDAGPERMAPYFDLVEKTLEVRPVREDILGENSKKIREGAEILGLSHGPLRRNANHLCGGCGVCCFGCPSDGKRPMHLTFIPQAIEAGTEIYPRCKATNLVREGRRITGVRGRFTHPNSRGVKPTVKVRAKVVVLSAGAIHTPAFLLKQKLANSSGQVGRNLTIHPAARVGAMFDEPIFGWKGVPQGYYVDEYSGEGIMCEGAHGPPALMGASFPGSGKKLKEYISDIAYLADFGVMVSDTGSGRVRVGPGGDPVMLYNINKEDVRRMVKGMALVASIYLAAGARVVLPGLWSYPEIRRFREVLQFREARIKAGHIQLAAFHPLGTCRMGADPKRSVVNADLKCHDLDNLYIMDGSVFPSSLGVNPQETIMAFTMKASEKLADKGPK